MSVLLINANSLRIPVADKSVQCVVTSPPYYGLRDYGTAKWIGGAPICEHNPPKSQGMTGQRADRTFTSVKPYKDICFKCGAVRQDDQIGLEETINEYLESIVNVFSEVWRILKDDGTCWINLGDSYSTNPGNGRGGEKLEGGKPHRTGMNKNHTGLKPKDLMGIPWRVAFALQDYGWYLRSDIIWHKPNPMPESVIDRPTKSHEYLFLLSKSQHYYYDALSIREPSIEINWEKRYDRVDPEHKSYPDKEKNNGIRIRKPAGWDIDKGSHGTIHRSGRAQRVEYSEIDNSTRNCRTVWTIATHPYKEAHFATFPPKLIEPCIKAGSKPGDIVLDPFNGSGTTCMVAVELGRNAIGIELNQEYIRLSKKRLYQIQPILI